MSAMEGEHMSDVGLGESFREKVAAGFHLRHGQHPGLLCSAHGSGAHALRH